MFHEQGFRGQSHVKRRYSVSVQHYRLVCWCHYNKRKWNATEHHETNSRLIYNALLVPNNSLLRTIAADLNWFCYETEQNQSSWLFLTLILCSVVWNTDDFSLLGLWTCMQGFQIDLSYEVRMKFILRLWISPTYSWLKKTMYFVISVSQLYIYHILFSKEMDAYIFISSFGFI